MPVTFSTKRREATIRNLADAPSPPGSAHGSLHPPSPQQQSSPSLRRKIPRPPPPPLYEDESESLPDDDAERARVPSLQGGLEDSVNTEGMDGSNVLDELVNDVDGESIGDTDEDSEKLPVTVLGYKLPCCTRKKTNWNRISSRVVRYAPCFWCMPRSETGITDRDILYRLNILCAFFSAGQIGSTIFFIIVTVAGGADRSPIGRDESNAWAPNLWSMVGNIYLLGAVAVVIFIATLVTLKVIKDVEFSGSLRYMWLLLWVAPLEFVLVVNLLDFHNVTTVWVKHWWYVSVLAWFREKYCLPGTSQTTCAVPICGLPSFGLQSATYPYTGTDSEECIAGEVAWCRFFFNATNCRDIRNSAQAETESLLYFYLYLNFAWGLTLLILLLLAINVLEGIITKPIVQKSRESNVPGWLTFPIVWSIFAGIVLAFSPSSVLSVEEQTNYDWVGVMFLAVGGLFFLAAAFGWFISAFSITNNRDKQLKLIGASFFIATLVLTILAVIVMFAAGVAYTIFIVDVGLTTHERGELACALDTVDSCSFCNSRGAGVGLVECPEWTTSDVTSISRTQLKQSMTLSIIFLIYAISALRFGFVLWKHINQYEIDYV